MRGFRKKPEKEILHAHYAVNLSRLNTTNPDEYILDLQKRIEKAVEDGLPVRSVTNPLHTTGNIYGPFENIRGAQLMAASGLNENDRDYFGTHWGFISTIMTESDYQRPLIEKARKFVCVNYEECGGVQRFKGACAKCKANGKPLVKTIEIRDWEDKIK
tara:strand:- start:73195 stop:73671 length:477 start_codon:yes stop_codon:yes gene_type:complete